MLRIVELAEGNIYIDGQDTRQVGLAKLRSSIAVIPQDPVLYSGTVRTNLDPFGDYDDNKLYEVLRRVGLYKSAGSSSGSNLSLSSFGQSKYQARIESLADDVTEGGSNFSVGTLCFSLSLVEKSLSKLTFPLSFLSQANVNCW